MKQALDIMKPLRDLVVGCQGDRPVPDDASVHRRHDVDAARFAHSACSGHVSGGEAAQGTVLQGLMDTQSPWANCCSSQLGTQTRQPRVVEYGVAHIPPASPQHRVVAGPRRSANDEAGYSGCYVV